MKSIRFFLFEYTFKNISFQCFLILFTNAFVCDAKLGSITCTYNIVNVLLKSFSSFAPCYIVIVKQSISLCLMDFLQPNLPVSVKCFLALFFISAGKYPHCTKFSFSCWSLSFGITFEHAFCLGWKLRFSVPISGPPIGRKFRFVFWFRIFRLDFFFEFHCWKVIKSEFRFGNLEFWILFYIGSEYISFHMRH